MKYHNIEQGHKQWFSIRMGKPTASELCNLLTPEFKLRTGETPKTYVYMKVAEAWRGQPMIFQGSWATEQGEMREEEAVPFLAIDNDWKIDNGGFIESDDGLSGCSPDGLVNLNGGDAKCDSQTKRTSTTKTERLSRNLPNTSRSNSGPKVQTSGPEPFGIEVKCPEPHTHVRYLIDGVVPKHYITQVHGGMFVTGFKKWVFCSYHRDFPPLVITVERDEKIIKEIAAAVKWFHWSFEASMNQIKAIQDGKPFEGMPMEWTPEVVK